MSSAGGFPQAKHVESSGIALYEIKTLPVSELPLIRVACVLLAGRLDRTEVHLRQYF
jgi:hypothetical protein